MSESCYRLTVPVEKASTARGEMLRRGWRYGTEAYPGDAVTFRVAAPSLEAVLKFQADLHALPEVVPHVGEAPSHPGEVLTDVLDAIRSYTRHQVECAGCGVETSTRKKSKVEFGRELVAEGWRGDPNSPPDDRTVHCPDCKVLIGR